MDITKGKTHNKGDKAGSLTPEEIEDLTQRISRLEEELAQTRAILDITEKKEAERVRLGIDEKRFRQLVEKALSPICILKGEEMVLELGNEPLFKVWNTNEGAVGKPLAEILPEVNNSPVMGWLLDVYHNGVLHNLKEIPFEFIRKSGEIETLYFNFVYQPWRESDGTISGVMAMATDITEQVENRKKIEESTEALLNALQTTQKQQRLYEAVTNNTPDLVYVFDLNYRFTYANTALLAMWGQTWENAIGKGLRELGYEEWHAKMHENEIDTIIATKKLIRGEVSFPHASLGTRFYDYILTPVFNEAGAVETIAGTTRDITDIKLAEEVIKKSEEDFRQMAELMPEKIATADADGNMLYYNKTWLAYTGMTIDELKGEGWEKIIHPDDLEELNKRWSQSRETGADFEREVRFQDKQGAYKWHVSRSVAIRNNNEEIEKWISAATEIQTQKEQKEALQKTVAERTASLQQVNVELQQKNLALNKMNKELESFSYVASHDLQEPLRKIQAFTGLLRHTDSENLSDKGKDYFLRIQDAARRMQMLIEDLLSFSRLTTTDNEFVKTDLNVVLDEVKTEFREVYCPEIG